MRDVPTGSIPPDRSSLALSPEALKELLELACSFILKFQRDIQEEKCPASYVHDSVDVNQYAEGRQVCAELREDTAPARGTDARLLLEDIFGRITANGTQHAHPGFMAHVPSGGLPTAAVAELITHTMNRLASVWVAAPGLSQIESNVIRWFCTLLGYGAGSFGYLTTGGSLANFMGLRCALQRFEECRDERLTFYTSTEGHFSVLKAARLCGVPASRFRTIKTHPDLTMNVEALRECIRADRAKGYTPACVIATAGTTNTGAIDDFAQIAECCRQEGLWLHVDACFGGFFKLTTRGKVALRGIEQADSIAVDAHKSLFLPHGMSALLVKERAALKAAFEIPGGAYMPGMVEDQESADFCNYGPELSRGFRGLTVWLPIKLHGLEAFERCLDERVDLAEYLEHGLHQLDGVEVIRKHPMTLPVVTFKLSHPEPREADRLNRKLCEYVCAYEHVYLTTTTLPGHGLVLRVCVLNHLTARRHMDGLLLDVKRSRTRIETEENPKGIHDAAP